jgi:hypothetical protein
MSVLIIPVKLVTTIICLRECGVSWCDKSQSTRDYKLLGLGLEGLVNLGETP